VIVFQGRQSDVPWNKYVSVERNVHFTVPWQQAHIAVLVITLFMVKTRQCCVSRLPVSSTSGSGGTEAQAGQQAAGPSSCLPRPAATAATLSQSLLVRRHSCHALRSCLQQNTTLAVRDHTPVVQHCRQRTLGSYLSSILLMDVTVLGSAGE
jgi:hypothetical protein